MATAQEKVKKEKKMYVGLERLELIAIQPTNEEVSKLFGFELDEDKAEAEYLGEDKDGNTQVVIKMVFKGTRTGKVFMKSFFITDVEQISKKESNLYINQQGEFQYTDTEDNLFTSFKNFTEIVWTDDVAEKGYSKDTIKEEKIIEKKQFRKAFKGEMDFYGAAKVIMNPNKKDFDDSVLLNTKKLFKGDFKELESKLLGENRKDIVAMLCVKTNNEGEKFQDIWTKVCLPELFLKNIESNSFPVKYGVKKNWDKFCNEIQGEGGCKSFFELGIVREYDPVNDPISTPGAIVNDHSDHVVNL